MKRKNKKLIAVTLTKTEQLTLDRFIQPSLTSVFNHMLLTL